MERKEKIETLIQEMIKKIEDEGLTASEAELVTHAMYNKVVETNRKNSSNMPFTSC